MSRAPKILLAAVAVVTLAAGGALAEPDVGAPLSPRRGDVLRIPGLPPIQLPPGARAFGPQGPGVLDEEEPPPASPRHPDQSLAPPPEHVLPQRPNEDARRRPARIAPHSVPTLQTQRVRVLDDLFGQLRKSPDADSAKDVATAIERVWLRSGSDTADLLMSRAVHAIGMKDLKAAEEILDSVVEIEPDWAEGWNKRATVRFFADNLDGAMSDIDHTLKLEPRHFGALAGLGAILQKSGLPKRALEAYRRALLVYPEQPDIRKAVEKLQLEVEGRDI